MALCSSPKPLPKVANPPAHGTATTTNKNDMPSDIDGFLTWMEADAGNLDKALATL